MFVANTIYYILLLFSGGWRTSTTETEVTLDGWCEGGLRQQRMTVEAEAQCAKDRKEWRALVHMQLNEFHAAIFGTVFFLRTALSWSGGYHM